LAKCNKITQGACFMHLCIKQPLRSTLFLSGVARIWCEEGQKVRKDNLMVTVTHKNVIKFMQ